MGRGLWPPLQAAWVVPERRESDGAPEDAHDGLANASAGQVAEFLIYQSAVYVRDALSAGGVADEWVQLLRPWRTPRCLRGVFSDEIADEPDGLMRTYRVWSCFATGRTLASRSGQPNRIGN